MEVLLAAQQCVVIIASFLVATLISASEVSDHTLESSSPGRRPEDVFHKFQRIVPEIHHHHRRVSSTLHKGEHLKNILVKFKAFNRSFILELTLNRDLFSDSYVEKNFHSKGSHVSKPSRQHHMSSHCYYHGTVRGQPHSLVALSTCDGIRGFISDDVDTYHIDPLTSIVHKIFRDSDLKTLPFKCGTETSEPSDHHVHRVRRTVHAPYDSNQNTRYVELYLVNDFRTFDQHGRNKTTIIKRSQDIANIVSRLYRPLNIYVALVGVEVWDRGDLVTVVQNADTTMENFLMYRRQRINPYHRNDNSQLITGIYFGHGVVGKAIKGPICTHKFSGGVNMDYNSLVTLVATTVAHEMGHNFGMEHDNDSVCYCPTDRCIMAATSGQKSPTQWSSCSKSALAEAFELGMDYCLRNKPQTIFQGPVCGNGFKEDGEQCDCGLPEDCTNRCCNASSCRLMPHALCGTGMCCDLNTCQFKQASTLCREPTGECDLPEFCSGISEFCPADTFVQDGRVCDEGQSYCYRGKCNSHTGQCKLLWGSTGRVSDPICFRQLNSQGNPDGNCGYNWTHNSYAKCDREDVMCGLLHCVHLNEKLMFWRDNLAHTMRASFLTRGNTQYVCRSTMLDVGLDMPDPGMVPDGAKCDEDKICLGHKCTPLGKLVIPKCPQNCNGRGVCNSNGNCHCDHGYSPPLCDRKGFGGSLDSGPASQHYGVDMKLLIGLLIFFLLVLTILGVLIYYNLRMIKRWWRSCPLAGLMVPSKYKHAPPVIVYQDTTPSPAPPPAYTPSLDLEVETVRLPGASIRAAFPVHVVSREPVVPPRTVFVNGDDTVARSAVLTHADGDTLGRRKDVTLVSGGDTLGRRSGALHIGGGDTLGRRSGALHPGGGDTLGRRSGAVHTGGNDTLGRRAVVTGGSDTVGRKGRMPTPSRSPKQDRVTPKLDPPPPYREVVAPKLEVPAAKPDQGTSLLQPEKVIKRESFRGSEISHPILVSTTNRDSQVFAELDLPTVVPHPSSGSRSPPLLHGGSRSPPPGGSRSPGSSSPPPLVGSHSPPVFSLHAKLVPVRRCESDRTASRHSARPTSIPPAQRKDGRKLDWNASSRRPQSPPPSRPVPANPSGDEGRHIYQNEAQSKSLSDVGRKASEKALNDIMKKTLEKTLSDITQKSSDRANRDFSKKKSAAAQKDSGQKTNDKSLGESGRKTSEKSQVDMGRKSSERVLKESGGKDSEKGQGDTSTVEAEVTTPPYLNVGLASPEDFNIYVNSPEESAPPPQPVSYSKPKVVAKTSATTRFSPPRSDSVLKSQTKSGPTAKPVETTKPSSSSNLSSTPSLSDSKKPSSKTASVSSSDSTKPSSKLSFISNNEPAKTTKFSSPPTFEPPKTSSKSSAVSVKEPFKPLSTRVSSVSNSDSSKPQRSSSVGKQDSEASKSGSASAARSSSPKPRLGSVGKTGSATKPEPASKVSDSSTKVSKPSETASKASKPNPLDSIRPPSHEHPTWGGSNVSQIRAKFNSKESADAPKTSGSSAQEGPKIVSLRSTARNNSFNKSGGGGSGSNAPSSNSSSSSRPYVPPKPAPKTVRSFNV